MNLAVISVVELHKHYGDIHAVKGISLEIEEGEIFGILGPNGAGKTTTIEILEGLRTADSGFIRVAGFDPKHNADEFRQLIGVQLQHTAVFQKIRVEEALRFFRYCYKGGVSPSLLLETFQLRERANSFVRDLSGGELQRLTLALALINDPGIIILDEPTTGMDPHARREIWKIITGKRKEGKTVLLTTHNMEEAEQLCDRIAIIDTGVIIALGTPRELVKGLGADKKISFSWSGVPDADYFKKLPGVSRAESVNGEISLFTPSPRHILKEILSRPETAALELEGLRVSDANLEDVFLNLTGRRLS